MQFFKSKSLVVFAAVSALFAASCQSGEESLIPKDKQHSSARPIEPCEGTIQSVYDLDFPLQPVGPGFPIQVKSPYADGAARFKIEPITSTYDHSAGGYGNWFNMNVYSGDEYTPTHTYTKLSQSWTSSLLYKDIYHIPETWRYKVTIQHWRKSENCVAQESAWEVGVGPDANGMNVYWMIPLY